MKRPTPPGERHHSEAYWTLLDWWAAFKYAVWCPSVLLCLVGVGASVLILWLAS